MKLNSSILLSGAVLCVSLLNSGAAMAQGTWNFTGSSCNPVGPTPTDASCTTGSVTADISVWGFVTGGTGFTQGNLAAFDPNGFGAYTGRYETGTTSQHAFDNVISGCGTSTSTSGLPSGTTNGNLSATANSGCGGNVEAMLLNFNGAKVNLSQVKVTTFGVDSDLSVYRWDGASSGPTMGSTVANLTTGSLGTGWTLVGSSDMDMTGANPYNTGATQYSSYFLVTTYFGATTTTLNNGNDTFKIATVTATTCTGNNSLTGGYGGNGGNGASCTQNSNVPEPGSLALAGLALFGVFASRRRVKALF